MLVKNLNKDIRILSYLLQKRIKCAISSISPESQCIQIHFDNGILGAWYLPVSIAKGRQPSLILAITYLLMYIDPLINILDKKQVKFYMYDSCIWHCFIMIIIY